MKKLWSILAMGVIGTAATVSVVAFVSTQKQDSAYNNIVKQNQIITPDELKSEITQFISEHGVFESRADAVAQIDAQDWEVTGIKNFEASEITGINEASIKIQNIELQDGYEWSAETPNPSFDLPIEMNIEQNILDAIKKAESESYLYTQDKQEEQVKEEVSSFIKSVDGVDTVSIDKTVYNIDPSEKTGGTIELSISLKYIKGVTTDPTKTFIVKVKTKIEINAELTKTIDEISKQIYSTPAAAEEDIRVRFNELDGVSTTAFTWISVPTDETSTSGEFFLDFIIKNTHYISDPKPYQWHGTVKFKTNISSKIRAAEQSIKSTYYVPFTDLYDGKSAKKNAEDAIKNAYWGVDGVEGIKFEWKDEATGKYTIKLQYKDGYIGPYSRDSYVNIKTNITSYIDKIVEQGANNLYNTAKVAENDLKNQIESLSLLPPNQISGTRIKPINSQNIKLSNIKETSSGSNIYNYTINLDIDPTYDNYFYQPNGYTYKGTFKIKINLDSQIKAAETTLKAQNYEKYATAIDDIVSELNDITGIVDITKDDVKRNEFKNDEFIIALKYENNYYAQDEYTFTLNMTGPNFSPIGDINLSYYEDDSTTPKKEIYIIPKGIDLSSNIVFNRSKPLANLAVSWTNDNKDILVVKATENLEGTVEEVITLTDNNNPEAWISFKVTITGAPKIVFPSDSPLTAESTPTLRANTSYEYKFSIDFYNNGKAADVKTNEYTKEKDGYTTSIKLDPLDTTHKTYILKITTFSNIDNKKTHYVQINAGNNASKNFISKIQFHSALNPTLPKDPEPTPDTEYISYSEMEKGQIGKLTFTVDNLVEADKVYLEIYDTSFWRNDLEDSIEEEGYSSNDGAIDMWLAKEKTNEKYVYTITIKAKKKNLIGSDQTIKVKIKNGLINGDLIELYSLPTKVI